MEDLITLGTDPEFFVEVDYLSKDKKNKSTVIEPSTLFFNDDVVDECGVHNDGYQAELKVEPHQTSMGMVNNIKHALRLAKNEFDKKIKSQKSITGYRFMCIPAIRVTKNQLKYGGEQCQVFGCKPDYNIYDMGNHSNKKPLNAKTHLFRYSGGHIHAGESILSKRLLHSSTFVKLCDVVVGNTMVMLDTHPNNSLRNKYYGKAGVFRQPEYGIEYRSLSSYWFNHPTIAKLTFDLLNLTANIMHGKHSTTILEKMNETTIKNTIDKFNRKQATNNFDKLINVLDELNIPNTLNKDVKEIRKLKYDNNILVNWGIIRK